MKMTQRAYRKMLQEETGQKIKWIYKHDLAEGSNLEIDTTRSRVITDGDIYCHGNIPNNTDKVLANDLTKISVRGATAIIVHSVFNDTISGGFTHTLDIYGGYMTAKDLYIRYIKGTK